MPREQQFGREVLDAAFAKALDMGQQQMAFVKQLLEEKKPRRHPGDDDIIRDLLPKSDLPPFF